jgi:hypothetical protein
LSVRVHKILSSCHRIVIPIPNIAHDHVWTELCTPATPIAQFSDIPSPFAT